MSKRTKIVLLIILASVAAFVIAYWIFFEYFDPCPRCKKPVVSKRVSEIGNNYTNLKIVYSTNNGALPPPYHRSKILTITTDASGTITGEYKISDGRDVLEKKTVAVSKEQLASLIAATAKINSQSDNSVNLGCTGGTGKSLEISQNDTLILEAAAYYCAGKSTDEGLEKVSVEFEKLL